MIHHASLFSGIGGFDLAAQRVGFKNIFSVEKDLFCNMILKKHFPETKRYFDVKKFRGKKYAGTIDIISGGFPCQPFSIAGQRRGTSDDRYLWTEMFRIISEIKPRWIIAENVPGIVNIENGMAFEQTIADLEEAGYEVESFIIPALAVNAPHRRDRLWIIANSNQGICRGKSRESEGEGKKERLQKRHEMEFSSESDLLPQNINSNSDCIGSQGVRDKQDSQRQAGLHSGKNIGLDKNWYEIATEFCRVDDGILNRTHRLKSIGNSIVPQIAEKIFQAIAEVEEIK